MLIRGARVAVNSESTRKLDLWIHNETISFSAPQTTQSLTLTLDGYLVLPGLINAHDHLEFNLFPRLGRGPYANASAWAHDIYKPEKSPIREHLSLPKTLRLRWGGVKNLLSGATTVAHHNAFDAVFLEPAFPVRVVRRYGWAHSLRFSADWRSRLWETPKDRPFIIHAAEGTDEESRLEIATLAEAGAFGRRTIIVHGVGIGCSELPIVERGAGIVWCPSSNVFTLGRSLDGAVLKSSAVLALGSDSAISGTGDLLDEFRFARGTIDAHRLYAMVTTEPARMFDLPASFGAIAEGGPADLLVLRDRGVSPAETLLEANPELVLVRGCVRLVSAELAAVCPPIVLKPLQQLDLEGRGRYWVDGPISEMIRQTKQALREPARLAGKAIAA